MVRETRQSGDRRCRRVWFDDSTLRRLLHWAELNGLKTQETIRDRVVIPDKRRYTELMQRKVGLRFPENLERNPARLTDTIGPHRMRIDRR